MSVEPLSVENAPIGTLRDMLAASPAFQAWVGAEDAAEAKGSIHYVKEPTPVTRPFAVVDCAKFLKVESLDGGGTLHAVGDLFYMLEAEVDDSHDDADAQFTFQNITGAILFDLMAIQGRGENLRINSIERVNGPARPEKRSSRNSGDFIQSFYLVSWGP